METFLLALIWFYPDGHFPPFYKAEPLRFETRAACEVALEKMNSSRHIPLPSRASFVHVQEPRVQYVACMEPWALHVSK